ncbi:hypothetical protein [Streptomyces sp. NPDC003832]
MATLHPRIIVRTADLVDVPAVVRLFSHSTSSLRLPLESQGEADAEQAQRAMRLMLAHHAIEEGEVWLAEAEDGTLAAVSIWLPPDSGAEPPHARFRGLLSRELDAPAPDPSGLAQTMRSACPEGPHWKLVTVMAPNTTEDHGLLADVLGPGLSTADDQDATVVAIALSVDLLSALRPLGFTIPREVQLAPGASVFLARRG